MNSTSIVKLVTVGLVGLIILIFVMKGVNVVNTGTVGVKRVWGKIDPNPIAPGLTVINPISSTIEIISTKLVPITAKVNAASKDLQVVTTQVTVGVSANGSKAPDLLANIGNLDALNVSVISPAIQECVKAVTAKYSAENLIIKREEAKKQVEEAIRHYIADVLMNKGIEGATTVQSVAITDFNFSHEFNQAIESKVKAEQDALREVNDKAKRITSAEAMAKETELNASAQAFSITTKAKSEAESITAISIARAAAIQREAEALAKNPNIIELRKVEKWNGALPVYSLSGAGTLIQLPTDKK
ncbi:MAG: prohibitin family protein [Chthoniobacterales bacterium]